MTHCPNRDPHYVHGLCCLQAAGVAQKEVQFHCKNLSESISSVAGAISGLFPQATLLLIDFFNNIDSDNDNFCARLSFIENSSSHVFL